MSTIGARYPCFKPHGGNKGVNLGPLVTGNLTINYASGQAHGDDVLQEEIKEFVSGSFVLETLDLEDSTASVIYGCKVEGKRTIYNVDDEPPHGELAYYKTKYRKEIGKYFKVYYYPDAQASIGNDNAQTKNGSINFQTNTTNFTIYAKSDGSWRETEEFDTAKDAQAWIDQKLSVDKDGSKPGVLTVTCAAGTASGKTAVTVTPALESGNLYRVLIGSSVTAPVYDADCSGNEYQDWDGTSEITAASGDKLLVVECTADGKTRKAGIATVVSAE